MSRIFLIPGLGADCRIYKNIDLEDHEVIQVNWIEPTVTDTLQSYAQRIIDQYNITNDSVVIGNSMGGMVAVEIAKRVALKKVILISSIKTYSEAPWYFSLFRRFPVYKIIPGRLFTSLGFLVKPLFSSMSATDAALFADMLKRTSPIFAKWAMKAILNWNNTDIPLHTYHITGNKDLIFDYRKINNALIINDGTHIMIFDKAKEVNKLLMDIIK
ncbi:alpha/beta hydrolase [Mucilaginibacter hurinus]|uniref:Alpha/beta hydrolase n=1 Tax=Mucilaginibacter hurinus TaxID=2201324 RepID=A0A367GR37_9SPHI|nr:alpha/beta hydrolase [Mucilaginibacter hurinus]RCH55929.1 alpha/beta hydrolase [Mucilaginibacter hurinus]